VTPEDRSHLFLGEDCHYKKELRRLQIELVKFQEWVRLKGLRVVVLFEGPDAVGKGGAIRGLRRASTRALGCSLRYKGDRPVLG